MAAPVTYNWEVREYIWKNDGSGDHVWYPHSGSVTVPAGTTYTVNFDLHPNPYTREGYRFLGYAETSSGGVTAQPGEGWAVDMGTSSYKETNLYCYWVPATYTISYNAGGGSGAPASQTKSHGINLTLSGTSPTWTGHTFQHWNTKADGTGTSYDPGDTFSTDADTTLYAIWQADTYTVTYNANGGTGAPAAQTKTFGVDLSLSSTVPTRTDYDFVEWNTASDGTGTSYHSNDTYTANAALTLYAIWQATTYTVTYNANGHGTAPAAQTKSPGGSVTVAAAISATGCSFVEWNTAADGSGTSYDPGDTYSADADVTLYALWLVGVYTITFDADGGIVSPATKQVNYGSKYGTLPTPFKYNGSGKNKLPFPNSKPASSDGIDFTYNSDGSITFSGTASALVNISFPAYGTYFDLTSGSYVLTGGINNSIYLTLFDGTDSTGARYDDKGNGADVSITTGHVYNARLVILSGTVINTPVTIYPMLRPAGTSSEYEPYIPAVFYGWFLGDLLITANSIVEIQEDSTLKAAWTPRSIMRVKGSDNALHSGALYVKGSDGNMHMAIAYVKGSDGQMHING